MITEDERRLCEAKHMAVDEKIIRHEKWLAEHEGKIDVLCKDSTVHKETIKNLCEKIEALTKALEGYIESQRKKADGLLYRFWFPLIFIGITAVVGYFVK